MASEGHSIEALYRESHPRIPVLDAIFFISRAPPTHRLERKCSCDNGHNNIQSGADKDGHGGARVRDTAPDLAKRLPLHILPGLDSRSDDSTQNAHYTVESNGNAVSGTTVSGGQDFGSVGVERSVVDVLLWKVSDQ